MRDENPYNNLVPQSLVKILWTGGFDSTFRVVQLSRLPVSIQPYYLDDRRKSMQKELAAIAAITADIEKHPETKCTMLPLITYKVTDIENDSEISETFQRVKAITSVGTQYEWLARFAKTCPGLEIGFEKCESNNTYIHFHSKGSLQKLSDGIISYAILNKEKSDADWYKIFGNFHYPLPMLEMTKLEAFEECKKLEYVETMMKTWFCHKPLNDEPCGTCNPCKGTIEEGFSFRFSPKGLRRYRIEKKYGGYAWFSYYKRIRRRLLGY